jgi:hypothetical protein
MILSFSLSFPSQPSLINVCFTETSYIFVCRHELHVNQYRAMFVRNCKIIETERLKYPADRKRKRNQRRKKQHEEDSRVGGPGMMRLDPNDAGVDEVFKPIQCGECGVEVAVLDSDEVYHFFHVVPTFS